MPQDDNPAALLKHREGVSLRCVFVVHVTAPAALDTLSLHDALPIFVNAALGQESQSEYYLAAEGRMLGNDGLLEHATHLKGGDTLGWRQQLGKADMEAIAVKTRGGGSGVRYGRSSNQQDILTARAGK